MNDLVTIVECDEQQVLCRIDWTLFILLWYVSVVSNGNQDSLLNDFIAKFSGLRFLQSSLTSEESL